MKNLKNVFATVVLVFGIGFATSAQEDIKNNEKCQIREGTSAYWVWYIRHEYARHDGRFE
jgi:hypothetical protein